MSAFVLYAGNPEEWPLYQRTLTEAFGHSGVDVHLDNAAGDPALVDYIVYAPGASGLSDFSPYVNLKAVLSLWAGVETFQHNETLQVPLARMVDPGLCEGMSDWVLGHVLRCHLGMDAHIFGQDGIWRNDVTPPLARQRRVGVLGLGALGIFVARRLSGIGFHVSGWSRRQKDARDIACYAGKDGLHEVLATSEILILLLPLTRATENILDAAALARLPKGACVLNPGRGALIKDAALLAALDKGHVKQAILDVFRDEPLAPEHPFWAHPRIIVTPHIASATRAETASLAIAENIRRGEAGEEFLHLVDRLEGY